MYLKIITYTNWKGSCIGNMIAKIEHSHIELWFLVFQPLITTRALATLIFLSPRPRPQPVVRVTGVQNGITARPKVAQELKQIIQLQEISDLVTPFVICSKNTLSFTFTDDFRLLRNVIYSVVNLCYVKCLIIR